MIEVEFCEQGGKALQVQCASFDHLVNEVNNNDPGRFVSGEGFGAVLERTDNGA